MFEDLLIVITVLVFVPTFAYIAKRDDLSGLTYLILFVYTIFTQIGYVHYPQLSASQGVYFGQSSFYSYWLFIVLSLIACFAGFWLRQRLKPAKPIGLRGSRKLPGGLLFVLAISALLTYIGLNFTTYVLNLHYGLDSGDVTPGYARFLYATRLLSLITVVIYANCWNGRRRLLSLCLLLPSLLVYLAVAAAAGSRSDILYLGIAIAAFHMQPFAATIKKRLSAVVVCAVLACVLLYSLTVLEYVRERFAPITSEGYLTYFVQPQEVLSSGGAEALLAKDYYWPTHLLFAAVDHDVIDPVAVLRSNLANSLAGFHVEYLTELLSRAGTGHSDRISGFAFHLFVEGFVAAGWLGWLYNGLIWNLGLHLWKAATRTGHEEIDRVLLALAAFVLPGIMRAQSCAFVKMLWYMYLPAALLLLISYNLVPTLKRHLETDTEKS